MKSLHALRSTAMLLSMVTGAGIASTVPIESAYADTTDIHDIFSPSVRASATRCHCENAFMAFDPTLTVCLKDGEVTTVHSGCY